MKKMNSMDNNAVHAVLVNMLVYNLYSSARELCKEEICRCISEEFIFFMLM